MGIFLTNRGRRKTFKVHTFILASVWILGLITGGVVAARVSLASALNSFTLLRTSVLDLIFFLVLPFGLSFVILKFVGSFGILPLAFIKAYSLISTLCYVSFVFGDAGWLIGGIFFFSDVITTTLLLKLWFDISIGKCYKLRQCFFLFIIIPVLIGLFDYFVVSPFLAMLLNY